MASPASGTAPRLALLGKGRRWLTFAVLGGLATAALNVTQVLLFGRAIDDALAHRFEVGPFLQVLAPVVLLRALLALSFKHLGHQGGAEARHEARRALFAHLLRLGPGVLGSARTGALVNTAVEGVESLGPYFGLYLPQAILGVTQPLVVCAAVATMDRFSGLVLLVVVPAIPGLLMVVRLRFKAASERYFATANQLSAQFLDAVQGLPTLKLFNQGRAHGALLAGRTEALRADTMRLLLVNQLALFAVDWIFSLGTVVASTWLAVTRHQAGALTFGQAVALLLLSLELSRPLSLLGSFFFLGALGRTTLGRLKELLAIPAPGGVAEGAKAPQACSPRLRFEGVEVTYPEAGDGADRAQALAGVSFEVQPGQRVALVGPSGSGKSTLVNVLLRFVDPSAGRVWLDGHLLESLPLGWLRRQVALVSQDTFLFHGSVADNLRLARPGATQAELEAAARAAQAHDFIAALPEGYRTQLGEHGARLSGGQRQRLAIARALLSEAPIVVLDEPTAHMDPETEAALQAALDRLTAGRTVLTIAHRLSTTRRADQVVVLDRGTVVEAGPPAELLARGGVYARLASLAAPGPTARAG